MNNIKILSGWSNTGGSTEAFINLTNALNKLNYDVTFYGPHEYHLDKCKSGKLHEYLLDKNDILICHFLNISNRLQCKKIILNCHEKEIFPLYKVNKYWDIVVFLNEIQREYHSYNDKYVIIPNIRQSFKIIDKSDKDLIAGIIGTIDYNKQTHVSIERALSDGCKKIYLYGEIRDILYFNQKVKPLLSDNVIYIGYLKNKQEMYNSIGRVYHSSLSEVASLVKDECVSTNTNFFGSKCTDIKEMNMSNKEILQKWIDIFND